MSRETDKILNIARADLGYYAPSDPLTGSKAGRWMHECWGYYKNKDAAVKDGILNWEDGSSWLANMSSRELWWCCCFVSMVVFKALHPRWNSEVAQFKGIPGLPNYQCDNFLSKLRNAGKGSWILSNKRTCQPGDIVLFDWDSNNTSNHYTGLDHIGFIEANLGSYVQTIEGNTSGSWNGSQSAGNGVYRRTRYWSNIACIVRPPYSELTVWKSEVKPKPEPVRPEQKPDYMIGGSDVFRIYNPYTGDHMFTTYAGERDGLVKLGWKNENIGWKLDNSCNPVYRLCNSFTGDHLLTQSLSECQALLPKGWTYEGVVDYASKTKNNSPIYRLFDGTFHMYTTSENEKNTLIKNGWIDEGVAWYQRI